MPELLNEHRPKARKAHQCSVCTGPIHPGETYERATYVYDGRVYDWLTCAACERDHIVNLVWEWTGGYYDEGVGPEDAHEWANDQAMHGSPEDQRAAKNYLQRWSAR